MLQLALERKALLSQVQHLIAEIFQCVKWKILFLNFQDKLKDKSVRKEPSKNRSQKPIKRRNRTIFNPNKKGNKLSQTFLKKDKLLKENLNQKSR